MNIKIKDKITASVLHLSISALLILAFVAIIFLRWFPNNLYLAGASTGLVVLISADLVLGPLLTFVVYNKEKKSLKFDLSCIILLQLACFIYGATLIYQERPILQILADDGIRLVTIKEAKRYQMNEQYLAQKHGFFSSPHFAFLSLPADRKEYVKIKLAYEVPNGGKPLALKDDLLEDITRVDKDVFDARITFIRDNSQEYQLIALNDFIQRYPTPDCDWLPLHSYHVIGYACVHSTKGIINFKRPID